MKLFVTGGTGFIGSHFINQAHASGHEVVALRRTEASAACVALEKSPTWITAALDEVPVSSLQGCDAIVHLAAHTPNVPYDTLENCLFWNVMAPLKLFRTAIDARIDRFVVAGSCFEYGKSGERYEFIPTDAPLEPTQSYPASKAAASIAFCQLAVEENLKLSVHRIFQVYGEGELETRLWPSLRRAALAGEDFEMTTGEQVRDFVSVTDVARMLLDATTRDDVRPSLPEVKNIGSGQPTTLHDFAQHWWKAWNATGKIIFGANPQRTGEVMRYVPDMGDSADA